MTRHSSICALLGLVLALAPAGAASAAAARKPSRGALATATGATVIRAAAALGAELRIEAAGRAGVRGDTLPAAAAADAALAEAARLDAVLGEEGAASELGQLNQAAADERVTCSPELFDALTLARGLAEATEGAWDPTAGPLRFRGPDTSGDVRTLVGWRMLLLDASNRTVRLQRQGMRLALGDVGRGFLLDRLAPRLRERGVTRARLALGDVVLAFTPREAWTMMVPDPAGNDALGISLANAAAGMASPMSAPRVIDPRNGRAPTDQATVVVIDRSAARAAGMARALLVSGRVNAADWAGAHPESAVLWLEFGAGGDGLRVWTWNMGRVVPLADRPLEFMTNR
jgi:FAD:protein FMN transferase